MARTLKEGMSGQDVQAWQQFMRGFQIADDGTSTAGPDDVVVADGKFGPKTTRATKAWQTTVGTMPDGVIGTNTWMLAVKNGFNPEAVPTLDKGDQDVDPDPSDTTSATTVVDKTLASWPPRPSWAKPLVSQAERDAVLGKIEYVAAPTASNPEAVHITNDWAKDNIVKFDIPQLSKNPISMHKSAGPQFKAWLDACEKMGVLNIISFGGCWVPRFVRGSKTRLSNHTWASAIDINVPWNGRGRQSALVGQKGCLREMVELAPDFGLFSGMWYKGAPEDGMHIELFKILSGSELLAARQKYGV